MQHLKYTSKKAVDQCIYDQDVYLVTHEINDAILSLLIEEIM